MQSLNPNIDDSLYCTELDGNDTFNLSTPEFLCIKSLQDSLLMLLAFDLGLKTRVLPFVSCLISVIALGS